MNDYKGYSLFNDVEDAALRTYNRCTVLFNMNLDHGEDLVQGYAELLDNVSRMQMMAMYQYIAVRGLEEVKLEITQGKHSTLNIEAVH